MGKAQVREQQSFIVNNSELIGETPPRWVLQKHENNQRENREFGVKVLLFN